MPVDELLPTAMEIAKQIVGNDARMVQGIKELMMEYVGASFRGMYDAEKQARNGKLSSTPVEEGFKAFVDRKGRK